VARAYEERALVVRQPQAGSVGVAAVGVRASTFPLHCYTGTSRDGTRTASRRARASAMSSHSPRRHRPKTFRFQCWRIPSPVRATVSADMGISHAWSPPQIADRDSRPTGLSNAIQACCLAQGRIRADFARNARRTRISCRFEAETAGSRLIRPPQENSDRRIRSRTTSTLPRPRPVPPRRGPGRATKVSASSGRP
jgi:hypothetical protein